MALYAAACAAIIAIAGGVFAMVFTAHDLRASIALSAGLAFVVQMAAFAIARMWRARSVVAGWGIGALICFATLICYGIALKALGVRLDAPLLSLATFFFLTELVEPLLLAR